MYKIQIQKYTMMNITAPKKICILCCVHLMLLPSSKIVLLSKLNYHKFFIKKT